MTPAYLNSSSPSLFAAELDGKDQHHQHSLISSNLQPSSSSSLSCHIYFHSSTTTHDQSGYCHSWETHQQQYQQEVDNNLGSHGGAYDDDVENESDDNGLKLSLWKKEGKNENQSDDISVKWMSSKMRLMQNMKINSDHDQNQIAGVDMIFPNSTSTTTTHKFEDHKVYDPLSPPAVDTDNSSSNNNNNNNIPVRVCADCKTTKTPLWRSGPRGPKSLCNACGIRQRKARRAMAAANGTIVGGDQASPMKSKVEHRDKRSKNGHVGKYKKRSKMANPSDHTRKRLCFEDFLISLSKNLAFHRVFPQDEKEAAILLMALSCGFVHD